jgi:hypothetical protein
LGLKWKQGKVSGKILPEFFRFLRRQNALYMIVRMINDDPDALRQGRDVAGGQGKFEVLHGNDPRLANPAVVKHGAGIRREAGI